MSLPSPVLINVLLHGTHVGLLECGCLYPPPLGVDRARFEVRWTGNIENPFEVGDYHALQFTNRSGHVIGHFEGFLQEAHGSIFANLDPPVVTLTYRPYDGPGLLDTRPHDSTYHADGTPLSYDEWEAKIDALLKACQPE